MTKHKVSLRPGDMTADEVALFLGYSINTIESLRGLMDYGPAFTKRGVHVVYDRAIVERWAFIHKECGVTSGYVNEIDRWVSSGRARRYRAGLRAVRNILAWLIRQRVPHPKPPPIYRILGTIDASIQQLSWIDSIEREEK